MDFRGALLKTSNQVKIKQVKQLNMILKEVFHFYNQANIYAVGDDDEKSFLGFAREQNRTAVSFLNANLSLKMLRKIEESWLYTLTRCA